MRDARAEANKRYRDTHREAIRARARANWQRRKASRPVTRQSKVGGVRFDTEIYRFTSTTYPQLLRFAWLGCA